MLQKILKQDKIIFEKKNGRRKKLISDDIQSETLSIRKTDYNLA